MIFDAGLFFIMLGIAIVLFFLKLPYKEAFMFISASIFLVIGFILFADYDVMFVTYDTVTDGVNTFSGNNTYYVIGDATSNYNESSKILAVFFVIIGIITALISFVMFINTNPRD